MCVCVCVFVIDRQFLYDFFFVFCSKHEYGNHYRCVCIVYVYEQRKRNKIENLYPCYSRDFSHTIDPLSRIFCRFCWWCTSLNFLFLASTSTNSLKVCIDHFFVVVLLCKYEKYKENHWKFMKKILKFHTIFFTKEKLRIIIKYQRELLKSFDDNVKLLESNVNHVLTTRFFLLNPLKLLFLLKQLILELISFINTIDTIKTNKLC